MDKRKILNALPAFQNEYKIIHSQQSVKDIINEVLEAHEVFADDYDKIALFFEGKTLDDTCDNLVRFCLDNFRYDEQDENNQATMSPCAMLNIGHVDCKNFAGFIGGALSALDRAGTKINWCYRFASYKIGQREPHHVFVVVNPKSSNEIWLDPTPGSNNSFPVWEVDKKIKNRAMALSRITGTAPAVIGKNKDATLRDIKANAGIWYVPLASAEMDCSALSNSFDLFTGHINQFTAEITSYQSGTGDTGGGVLNDLSVYGIDIGQLFGGLFEQNPDTDLVLKNLREIVSIQTARRDTVYAMMQSKKCTLPSVNPTQGQGLTEPKTPDQPPVAAHDFFDNIMEWIKNNPILAAGVGVGAWYLISKRKK